ncbi:MAG TPA: BNR-4 repeat-containing protein [Thermoguttaceae bacterium]|nr:BNR-4 repeat-containing protein [Thermoguttaceae bacterium]
MNRTLASTLLVLVVLLVSSCPIGAAASPSQAAAGGSSAAVDSSDIELGIGGTGGVYLLAEPGELVVDVEKRDRNARGRRTDLRAILVGPDRRVLQDVTIPDDGEPKGSGLGPAQRVRLSTQVERKGVYGLNVTVSQDRYGDCIVWGFRTNCPHYLIETSRGHRDQRREEPIVLLNADRPGNVCFLPRQGEFGMEITGVPKGVDGLPVYDGGGSLVHTLPVNAEGQASYTFPADVHRDAIPWRLHLAVQQATVQIDGVTRWESGDLYPNLPYWTPDSASFFPFQAYRWLLTPYRKTVYGRPAEQGEMPFQVHNNSDGKKTIQLAVEFPDGPWPARLSTDRVVVGVRKAAEVTLQYTVPAEGQTRVCHLRATPAEDPDFSTYSTLTVKAGEAPAAKPLEMPLVLKPYEHENEQFGYLPDYPVETQMYHDLENRPFVRVPGGVATLRDGQWSTFDLETAVQSSDPEFKGRSFGRASTKIAFDRAGEVYLLGTVGRHVALLHSADGGKTFSPYLIPGRENQPRAFDVEQFSGHNVPDGPPPVLRYTRTAEDPKLIWRKVNDLELFLPEKVDGHISLGEPILISKLCIGLAAHSGIPATVVSRDGRVHVVWAEATDPQEKVPGVPTYVATYDRRTRTLGKPALVGYGAPPNDVHNSPSITMDSQGYLHALAGTHGAPFQYARSLEPNDAGRGWTEAEPVGEGLGQTYIGMVCGPDDTLHLVFRLWRNATEPFPASHHATLAYQRKRPGEPWQEPRVLIVPPFSEYSVFYHRLTIDRLGRLFLSYDYWSTYWFYRTDHRGDRRALVMSPDGGETWKLAETRDLR